MPQESSAQIQAPEGAYICICHPRVIYGAGWRKVLRRIQRARRRAMLLDVRSRHREYSEQTRLYRRLINKHPTPYLQKWGQVIRKQFLELKKFEGSGL